MVIGRALSFRLNFTVTTAVQRWEPLPSCSQSGDSHSCGRGPGGMWPGAQPGHGSSVTARHSETSCCGSPCSSVHSLRYFHTRESRLGESEEKGEERSHCLLPVCQCPTVGNCPSVFSKSHLSDRSQGAALHFMYAKSLVQDDNPVRQNGG